MHFVSFCYVMYCYAMLCYDMLCLFKLLSLHATIMLLLDVAILVPLRIGLRNVKSHQVTFSLDVSARL